MTLGGDAYGVFFCTCEATFIRELGISSGHTLEERLINGAVYHVFVVHR